MDSVWTGCWKSEKLSTEGKLRLVCSPGDFDKYIEISSDTDTDKMTIPLSFTIPPTNEEITICLDTSFLMKYTVTRYTENAIITGTYQCIEIINTDTGSENITDMGTFELYSSSRNSQQGVYSSSRKSENNLDLISSDVDSECDDMGGMACNIQ